MAIAVCASPLAAQDIGANRPDSRVSAETYASPHGPLPVELDCSACHDADGWSVRAGDVSYDHDATAFPLLGRHADMRCAACHLDLDFGQPKIAVDDCAGCHADVHQGSLGTGCPECHTPESFEVRMDPEVHARTSFPLTGAHLLVQCESCHFDDRRPRFDALDTDCYTCHRVDYETTPAIDHVGLGFSTDCLACHNTVAWFNRARVPPSESMRHRR